MYSSAPLPFVGQKRMFAKEFIKVLGQFPDSTMFVDLFGGSGLLSHITKCVRPDAKQVHKHGAVRELSQHLDKFPRKHAFLPHERKRGGQIHLSHFILL